MNTKPFDLEKALAGEPVVHTSYKPPKPVRNVTRVGNRVAFQFEEEDTVYSSLLDGSHPSRPWGPLAMAPKTRMVYVNLWDSPNHHYTTHSSRQSALDLVTGRRRLNKEPIELVIEE